MSTNTNGMMTRKHIKALLLAGYGAEDISLMMGIAVGDLREIINFWRKTGSLRVLFGHASSASREFANRKALAVMGVR